MFHLAPPHYLLESLMSDLFSWINTSDVHPLIKSCVFYYEFEFIHPFQDGNGRLGILWQTAILKEWKKVFAWIPVESLIKDNQTEYYKALKSSDKTADSTLFIEFMLSLLLRTIEEIIENEKKVTVNQQKILKAIKDNPFIIQDELSKVIGLSRKSIIQNMKKMKDNGLIKRVGAAKNGHWEIL